ncbi:MAG: FHA domain-containing protein [Bryobacteraceae bacterium]
MPVFDSIRAWMRSRQMPKKGQPILYGLAGEYKGKVVPFDGKPIVIGRDRAAVHLVYPQHYTSVSSRHCQIIFNEGRFLLEDLESTNGTICNGKRLQPGKPVELKAGDRFHLGDPANAFEVRFY